MKNFILGFMLALVLSASVAYSIAVNGVFGLAGKDTNSVWQNLNVDASGNLLVSCQ